MTSLVSTLKKAVSTKETDGLSPKAARSLPASPSFSDFSLCAHADAADGYHGQSESRAASNRSSMEEIQPSSSPRWSYIFGQNTAPQDILAGKKKLQTASSDVTGSLPRSQEGKIGGMSYYDYCELIRTSSSL